MSWSTSPGSWSQPIARARLRPTSTPPELPPEYDAEHFDVVLAPVLAHLEGLLDAADPLRNAMPSPGSPADNERSRQATWAGAWGQTPIENALTTIRLLVVAGEGHIRSMVVLHGSTRPGPTSFDVLARAALEALAWAVWLVEPALGPEERLRRYENEVLYSLREQKKLGIPGTDIDLKIESILSTAEAVGIGTLPARKHLPRRLKDRPTATTLVSRLMLDEAQANLGETAYRVLSASMHATAYGLMRFVTAIGESEEANHQTGAIGLSSTEAIMMIRIVVIGYVNAVNRFSVYLGWQSAELAANIRNVTSYLAGLGH